MAPSPEQTATKLIAAGQYGDVAPELDIIELQTADLDHWPHGLQVLGHIYNGNLEDARFVWKRASDTHKQNSELKAAFALLQQLWNKNYQVHRNQAENGSTATTDHLQHLTEFVVQLET